MSHGQRNHDFASAQADAQMAYIEAERENKALCELCADLYKQLLNAYDPKEIEEFADDLREHGVVIDR